MTTGKGIYGTAVGRWSGIGPYYAMFPRTFSDRVVQKYTLLGDTVIDPFAGRGTAIFSAASHGRHGIGIEINPVGWIYGKTKMCPAEEGPVCERLKQIASHACKYRLVASSLPLFFHRCFSPDVLSFLLTARSELDWRRCVVDRTLMAFIVIYLHGKRSFSLSNQMRQTKAMAPAYAVRWWKERELIPPHVNALEFLIKRVRWRYAKGTPELAGSSIYLGDSAHILNGERSSFLNLKKHPAKLLLTSPPYFDVTNYHYDQWLRLWLLGGRPDASTSGGIYRGKFSNQYYYRALLQRVFESCEKLLSRDAIVYVRTDARPTTYSITREVLRSVFPGKELVRRVRPFKKPTQTCLFGDTTTKVGEVDLVLLPT